MELLYLETAHLQFMVILCLMVKLHETQLCDLRTEFAMTLLSRLNAVLFLSCIQYG